MIVSYYIFITSISILLGVSQFTNVNDTAIQFNDSDRSYNSPKERENTVLKNPLSNDTIINDVSDKSLSGNVSTVQDVNNPNTPELSMEASAKNQSGSAAMDGKKPLPVQSVDLSNSNDSLAAPKENASSPSPDDMPTFDEYRQKIEKESKQKREKADSIPSSPTMILKENNVVKTTGEINTNSQTINKESVDINRSSQSSSASSSSSSSSSSSTSTSSSSDSTSSASSSSQSSSIPSSHHDSVIEKSNENKLVPQNPIEKETESQKNGARTATLTRKLLKNNVAAKECGAKMLEFSSQITNADYVLNSNKDEYLNVPCYLAEKWFIVETCEPVQIRSIQIANFEMFSSRPKTFRVYSSDRYPVKHWYNLGLFRALDEKGIQTFTISDTNMVKYIKFEMVDHYGNEHYCPLTFVRILGTVVIDDIDEEIDDNMSADEDAPIDNVESKIPSDGILTKAKDILVKMVNGIGASKKQDLDQSIEAMKNIVSQLAQNDSDFIHSESPCYFIDFLIKEVQSNCESILTSLDRIIRFEKTLVIDNQISIENQIISQPFPYQIRADYFSIYHKSINNTHFQFNRLHRSFLNLSIHSTNDICLQRPWQNLVLLFKCNLVLKQNIIVNEPGVPNITGQNIPSGGVPDGFLSTVDIPTVRTTEFLTEDLKYPQPPGQKDPMNGNGHGTSFSTNGLPTLSNETLTDELNILDRNGTAESINKDNRMDKTESQIKETESIHIDLPESLIKQSNRKFEENFDQKSTTGAGSNAWNQAFMRIKNLAKQLEVNVSISMKYLEELSQNYKQQTDRLKKAQSLMVENMSNLENVVNQNHQETQKFLHHLNEQFQKLILKIKYGISLAKYSNQNSRASLNLSISPANEGKCIDLMAEELFMSSWWDSPFFVIFINLFVSVFFNLILLMFVFNRLKTKIINDIEKTNCSKLKLNREPIMDLSYIKDIPMHQASRSCGDLTYHKISPYPIVLPPRGVDMSFINSGCDSDEDRCRSKKELGPYFYTVQPNIRFVTPSKERKKKRKR